MWWLTAIGLLILAYLIGSIPTAYLVSKHRHVDVRGVGSGTSGATNVWLNVSRRWGLITAVADFAKGLAVVLIAKSGGADDSIQWGTGLAAVVGHNWSVFTGFRGGRGLLAAAGALLLLAPLQFLVGLGVILLLTILLNMPFAALMGFVSFPLSSLVFHRSAMAVWATSAVLFIILVKRMLSNDGFAPYSDNWKQVLLCRLFLDRDVRDRDSWVRRPPVIKPGRNSGVRG